MKSVVLPLLIVVSMAFAFRGGSVPEPGYDGSAGSVWLDRFLAEGGVSYSEFLSELELFETETGRGWGRRPSTWRWVPRIREWERMVPEMQGLTDLLGRLDLEWPQHAYLDALTAYVDFNRVQIRSTYGLEDRRTRFFETFAGNGQLYLNNEPDEDYESLDLVTWAVGEIRAMLSPDQMESAADIVSSGEQSFRPGRY